MCLKHHLYRLGVSCTVYVYTQCVLYSICTYWMCPVRYLYILGVSCTVSVRTYWVCPVQYLYILGVSCTVSVHTETIICRGLTVEHLKRFEHVRVIRGVLSLQGWDSSLPLLDFFRNVQYIGSEYFSLTTISTPGSSTALAVALNADTCRIDLSNLRQIRVGNVAFALNKDLCYIGDFQTDLDSTYLANPEVQNVIKQEKSYATVENCGVCNMYSCLLSMHYVCMSH